MASMNMYAFIFLTLTCSVVAKIVFVNERKNWTDAHQTCRNFYDGYLATIDITKAIDRKLLSSCMQQGYAFFGNYSIVSPFLKIVGCFKTIHVEGGKNVTLNTISAAACEGKCQTSYFAISKNSCICLRTFNETKTSLNAAHCDTRCDKHAYCGGDEYVNVYHSLGQTIVDTDNLVSICREYSCKDDDHDTVEESVSDCSHSRHFVCEGDTSIVEKGQWHSAFEICINSGSYLTRTNVCPGKNGSYWNGYFRSEYFIFDTDNIHGIPKRFTAINYKGESIDLSDPGEIMENIAMKFLCQTRDYIGTRDIDKECEISSIPESRQSSSAIPNVSQKGLFAGIAAGCAVLVIGLIVAALMYYRSRKIKKSRREKPAFFENGREGNMKEENSYTDTLSFRNAVHYSQVKVDNDSGTNKSRENAANACTYQDTTEGTYDHLHQQDTRKVKSESTYAHASLHSDESCMYDVTSRQRKESDDNDDDYSKFEKPDGIYD